jgi:protein O-mannosyl-transferase
LCLEKLPLLALSMVSCVITMIAQRAGGAVLTSAEQSPLLRIENVVVGYALYIVKIFWPSHLAALYPYPHTLPLWEVIASALFLLAITWAVLKYQRHRYLVVGWFWYLGTMVPMIGLVQVGNQAMADRYTYLPLVGIFIMLVWAMAEWAEAYEFSSPRLVARLLAATGIAILLALAAVTHIQIRYWHDDFRLWSRALAVTRNNYVAENNFALALIKQGKPEEAITHFRAASAIEPLDPASELNLGIYAQEHGDYQQAIARYEFVLRLATDVPIRATAYANLGTIYFVRRDYSRSQLNFESSMKLKRVFPTVLLDMGLIAARNAQNPDDWKRSADYFNQLVAVDPSDVAYLLLAHAMNQAGRAEDANLAYQQGLRLSRDSHAAEQQAIQLLAP